MKWEIGESGGRGRVEEAVVGRKWFNGPYHGTLATLQIAECSILELKAA